MLKLKSKLKMKVVSINKQNLQLIGSNIPGFLNLTKFNLKLLAKKYLNGIIEANSIKTIKIWISKPDFIEIAFMNYSHHGLCIMDHSG